MTKNLWHQHAAKIPASIRKNILSKKLIDVAVNTPERETPMEYLFDVYEEFLDAAGEHDDWNCFKCRQHAINQFRILKPYLEALEHKI